MTAQAKRDARRGATERGHKLGAWKNGVALTMADCTRCGSTLFLEPDGWTVSGSGVAAECPGDTLAAKLRDALDTRRIFTRTLYPSGSGTAYVRAYLHDRDECDEITWEIARLLDESPVHMRGSTERYGLKRGGYGYNRALDVLSQVARKVGTSFDQGRWTELS